MFFRKEVALAETSVIEKCLRKVSKMLSLGFPFSYTILNSYTSVSHKARSLDLVAFPRRSQRPPHIAKEPRRMLTASKRRANLQSKEKKRGTVLR